MTTPSRVVVPAMSDGDNVPTAIPINARYRQRIRSNAVRQIHAVVVIGLGGRYKEIRPALVHRNLQR